jgi:phosphatidylserine/phosphatidylglycerophosphate/cardiolipin synthase-like enzyme
VAHKFGLGSNDSARALLCNVTKKYMYIPLIGSDYPKKLVALIDSAKKNIDIAVYDWRWYIDQPGHPAQALNLAIVRAVRRGVQVRAVVNTAHIVPTLQNVGIRAKIIPQRKTLHAKLVIVDNETLVIGSHNFSRNAFASNIETSIMVDIPQGETRFQDFFNRLYGF